MAADGVPAQGTELRQWLVAGGVVFMGSRLLLVQNRRRNGELDWSTPGGVVDAGEDVLTGLTREVVEETGLVVAQWSTLLYRVHVLSPDFGFELQVEAYRAERQSGELVLDDPDGIVVDHQLVDPSRARQLLGDAARFVSEPLLAHVEDGVSDGRTFSYRLDKSVSGNGRIVVPVE